MAITIQWSNDPEENRRNIQAAIDAGETEINGERDKNGRPKPYRLNPLPVEVPPTSGESRYPSRTEGICIESKDRH
jgi:hypothetical protein